MKSNHGTKLTEQDCEIKSFSLKQLHVPLVLLFFSFVSIFKRLLCVKFELKAKKILQIPQKSSLQS
jgi:hypothetical protein